MQFIYNILHTSQHLVFTDQSLYSYCPQTNVFTFACISNKKSGHITHLLGKLLQFGQCLCWQQWGVQLWIENSFALFKHTVPKLLSLPKTYKCRGNLRKLTSVITQYCIQSKKRWLDRLRATNLRHSRNMVAIHIPHIWACQQQSSVRLITLGITKFVASTLSNKIPHTWTRNCEPLH